MLSTVAPGGEDKHIIFNATTTFYSYYSAEYWRMLDWEQNEAVLTIAN